MIYWIVLPLLAAVTAVTQYMGRETVGPPGVIASGIPPTQTHSRLYIESLVGVRTGAVSPAQRQRNTTILNEQLRLGRQLHILSGTRIEIASALTIGSGGSIIGDSGGVKPTIFMPASAFDNRSDIEAEHRYGSRSVGIDFSGQLSGNLQPNNGVRLENFRLISEEKAGRRLRGIVGRNVTNCSIRNIEIAGLPVGIGIALASARGCRVSNVHIHDFADNTAWKTPPQSTGIEIDNDILNGMPSANTLIEQFLIERLRVNGPLPSKWRYQTDGINIVHSASKVTIQNGRIVDVGEGIDTFGSDGTIDNVAITNSHIFGLKFIHGASRNVVRNVSIANAGLAGVNLSGSDSAKQNTAGNVLMNLLITNVGTADAWKSNSTAGILISGRNSRRVPVDNRVIGARFDLGPLGKYGWLDDSTGSGNEGVDVEIKGGAALDRLVLIAHGGGSVSLRRKPEM